MIILAAAILLGIFGIVLVAKYKGNTENTVQHLPWEIFIPNDFETKQSPYLYVKECLFIALSDLTIYHLFFFNTYDAERE